MSSALRAVTLLAGTVVLTSACCRLPRTSGPAPEELRPPLHEVTRQDQEMAALAFIAYTGEALEGSDQQVAKELVACLPRELGLQPLTRDRWDLAWGPAVFKFASAKLDDNMMYVARSRSRPEQLVVAVRGTNFPAILDWLREDFAVGETVAWEWTQDWKGDTPRISKATQTGLEALLGMKARRFNPEAPGGPEGEKIHLRHFLKEEVKRAEGKRLSVSVVGHSLGGALAPALGLWLEDTRGKWATKKEAEVRVWGFAGPTPGDSGFADYYDHRLRQTTQRIHNPYDVVPHTWHPGSIERIPGLYRPLIEPKKVVSALVCEVVEKTRDLHYEQQLPDARPIRGHPFRGVERFAEQAGCQHRCGYYRGLNLVQEGAPDGGVVVEPLILPITADCEHFYPREPGKKCKRCPEPACAVCPGWGG